MASGLTDDQLRRALLAFGEDIGPITPTTRGALERRLNTLRRGQSGRQRLSKASANALSSDESEIETGSSLRNRAKKRTPDRGRPEPTAFKKPSPSPRRGSRKSLRVAEPFELDTSESEGEAAGSHSPPRPTRRRQNHSAEEATVPPPASFLHEEAERIQQRFRERLDQVNQVNHVSGNGYIAKESEFALRVETRNWSQCVSWFLLLGAFLFFVGIGALYWQTTAPANAYSKLCTNIEEENCQEFIKVSQALYNLLTTRAGEYECSSDPIKVETRNLTVPEAKMLLTENFRDIQEMEDALFSKMFESSLQLFEKNPAMGIKVDGKMYLEAEVGAKSLWCRLRHSAWWTVMMLVGVIGCILLVCAVYVLFLYVKRCNEAKEREFFEVLENVIDILQNPTANNSAYQDSSIGHCIAVVNVRDAIFPPKDRHKKNDLWRRVVAFIEEKESRVSVEYRTINGEDFKFWAWNSHNDTNRQGKVWQGQAFSGAEVQKTGLTSCLEIKNMFDPTTPMTAELQNDVHNAILEKCEGNGGIVHMAFVDGSVYVKCSTPVMSGKAYAALHGWWFGGQLVTVKYMYRSNYLERFPEAATCDTPLRPSNDKRLSLSAPFHNSVLETS